MHAKAYAALPESHQIYNPLEFLGMVGGNPLIDFSWKKISGKRRLVGNPNRPTRKLHALFGNYIWEGIKAMGDGNYPLYKVPSSTAFVKGSNPLKNARVHQKGKFFYITDIWNAYPSVDLEKLVALVVYIRKHDEYRTDFSLVMLGGNPRMVDELRRDELFRSVLAFLESFFSGMHGKGLAVGGPLSPFLFNLYCEVYIDRMLRRLCERYRITYTRFADDLVFSRDKPITSEIRRELRACVMRAGFQVNHRKSKVLSREMGTVFVTKIGLHEPSPREFANTPQTQSAIITFPQKKRRKLHGIIGSYLSMQMDWPEKVSGFVAEFIHYYKNVETPTATDHKTFALCKKFEAEWSKYR